ncbi:MAG TPA: pilus assembly protein PilM [Candidatus Saccharimonadales bacterium]|nr:pilus assembly protein PilM [Candidatus Saccharimonadales bacterium]
MSQTILGIDIAYQALKIAGLTRQGKKSRLVGIGYAPIPKDSWKTDALTNQEEIAKTLRDLMKNAKPSSINTKVAMIALPEMVTYSLTLTMPKLSKKELDQALPFEVAEKLSINLDEYIIDYEASSSAYNFGIASNATPPIEPTAAVGNDLLPNERKSDAPANLPSTKASPEPDVKPPSENEDKDTDKSKNMTVAAASVSPGQPQIAIFAVAAKKTLIQSVMDFCELAHLELAGIDVKAGCIIRSLIKDDDSKIRLIVDLGANATGVNVAEGRSTRLISAVPLGTNNYKGEGDQAQLEAFKTQAEPIFDEIVHVTKFYQNRICPGSRVESIILVGGGSDIIGIDELFKQETGLPTTIGDPFGLIDTHHFPIPKELAHKYADSLGLALRNPHD